ncbi:hypothetical protein P3T18_005849 [Paraburkholderia sp. GAS199]|uniref:hypothetical protein n=1 Tax=Paraburkholderia sp. GAS199 TaxID=3035126 RepID=UPI003D19E4FE
MSTTVPLTLIEGSMALPRLRPLRGVPKPFGCEWALQSAGGALHAELTAPKLSALYAAALNTFCMGPETIRSFCQWEPLSEQAVAPPVLTSASVEISAVPGTVSGLVPEDARPVLAQTIREHGTPLPVPAAAVESAAAVTIRDGRRGGSSSWGGLAGGVCVLGGAAVLAWLGLGHFVQRPAPRKLAAVSQISPRYASPLVAAVPRVKNSRATLPEVAAPAAATKVESPSTANSASRLVKAKRSSPEHVSLSAANDSVHGSRVSRGKTNPHTTNTARANGTSTHAQFNASAKLQVKSPPVHADAHPANPLVHADDTRKPSAPGLYSPPARLDVDEYASMATGAFVHARTASTSNASPGTQPDWTNRLSQRRVTEAPDQFTK